MYLTAKYYIWENGDKDKYVVEILKKLFDNELSPRDVSFRAMYWRKANMIHKWFVENVQEGNDDCHEYYVSIENLKNLLAVVKKVLVNHALSESLLPTTSGFFFGDTEYNTYYFEELERTKIELEKLLANKNLKNYDFYYHSSW